MAKRISRKIAILLTLAMLMTSFIFTVPVNAASSADMAKANVKWDLKNNKTLKFKTTWTAVGTKTNTVKMTNFKIRNAKKKGYKQCTFTLTYTRNLNPTNSQIETMGEIAQELDLEGRSGDNGPFGGGSYYTVVDYKTGKSLEGKNNKNVTVKRSDWKYSNYVKRTAKDGAWIRFARKSTVKVTITYPKNYKNLVIGVGGYTKAPHYYSVSYSSSPAPGIGVASASGGIKTLDLSKFWKGKTKFSKETTLYSKKNKNYAHFMRVK